MRPTIISRKAGNWVDRGEPAVPQLRRVLAYYFDRHELDDQLWLDEHASLWHIAKAALVRDFAERVLQGEVPVNSTTPDSFSHWIASRLLTAEELAQFEKEAAASDHADRNE